MISRRVIVVLAIPVTLAVIFIIHSFLNLTGQNGDGARNTRLPFFMTTPWPLSSSPSSWSTGYTAPVDVLSSLSIKPISAVMVIAHCCGRKLDWIQRALSDVPSIVYTLDGTLDQTASSPSFSSYFLYSTSSPRHVLAVPAQSQGMVSDRPTDPIIAYLGYIVDFYYNLPDVVVFSTEDLYPWQYTEVVGSSGVDILSRLNLAYVLDEGFVSLQCEQYPGCDPESIIHIAENTKEKETGKKEENTKTEQAHYIRRLKGRTSSGPGDYTDGNAASPAVEKTEVGTASRPKAELVSAETIKMVWPALFPNTAIPPTIAGPRSAQFAASRAQILQVPLYEWVHIRHWVSNPPPDIPISRPDLTRLMEVLLPFMLFRHGKAGKSSSPLPSSSDIKCVPKDTYTCACRAFGICFYNETSLQDWTSLRDKEVGGDFSKGANTLKSTSPVLGKLISGATERGEVAIWRGIQNALNNSSGAATSMMISRIRGWTSSIGAGLGFTSHKSSSPDTPKTTEKEKTEGVDDRRQMALWPYYPLAEAAS